MQGNNAVRSAGSEFTEEPVSGVRNVSNDRTVWIQLIAEVQRIARLTCRGVPEHIRADVESAAMVGLMEAKRHFDAVDPEHFHQNVNVHVRNALLAEIEQFDPKSVHYEQLTEAANDCLPVTKRVPELGGAANEEIASNEHWFMPGPSENDLSPPDDAASVDALTPEDAFIWSYSATALRWGLAQLEKRERLVLRLSYKRGLALAAIAGRLQVSTPRAYQIRVEAERKLARLLGKSPKLSKMQDAQRPFDWDDHTNDNSRPAHLKLASTLGKR